MNNVTIRPVTAMFANTARPRPDRPHRPFIRRSGFAVFVDEAAIRCFRTEAEAIGFVATYPEGPA